VGPADTIDGTMSAAQAAHLVAGLVLLLVGRRLFWAFVAVLGFILGMELATRVLPGGSEVVVLVIAIAAGLVGAVLASWFYEVAIAVAGFVAGGRLGVALLALAAPGWTELAWLAFIAAGVASALLLLLLFDWALIVLSALLGASLIVESFALSPLATALLLIGLAIVGVAVQSQTLRATAG
jgi:hypothetical protein